MLLVGLIGLGLLGPLVALVILAVPPMLAGTYAGVRNVDGAVVDAARGMGMRGRDILFKVELPNALPLIIGGSPQLRAAGHLHRHHRGLRRARRARPFHHRRPRRARLPADDRRFVLVAVLAIVADLLLAGLQKLLVSPGLQAVPAGRRRLRAVPDRPAARAA